MTLLTSEKEKRLGVSNLSGCWPTPKQALLLKAALLRGPEALDAWKEWHNETDREALDFGSHRMLPQLYRNLQKHGVTGPELATFRNVYQYYWYKNKVLFHRATELLRSFRKYGIDTMVLKGAGLVSLYYRDPGLRPMQDFDLAVPISQATRAMDLLERFGWRSQFRAPEKRISIRHSTPYDNAEAQHIDLHWHVLGECWNFRRDEGFWRRSVPATIDGQPTRTLDGTDQLFHVCAHGVEWQEVSPIRWIADAMIILETAPLEIDWDRILQLVETYRLGLPIYDGLSYLQRKFHAPVPEGILKRLHLIPATESERFGYRVRTEPITEPTTGEILRQLKYEYFWLTGDVPIWRRPKLLVLWWQYKWKLERQWQLLFLLPSRALRRLFRQAVHKPQGYLAADRRGLPAGRRAD